MKKTIIGLLCLVLMTVLFACRNNSTSNKSQTATPPPIEKETTFYYEDYFGLDYFFRLFPDGTAIASPASDPQEIETLGDIDRHEAYLNPDKGYFEQGGNGCLYEVTFGGETFYIASDGYIYASYSDMRSRNHLNAYRITTTK